MMPFFKVNGVDIDIGVDDLDRQYQDIQTFDRTEGLTYEGALYASKRMWSIKVPWDASEDRAIATRDWVKGRGHFYSFERVDGVTTRFNKYSTDGGPGFNFNIFSLASPKFGTWAAGVASSLTTTVTAGFGSEGRYSFSVWKLQAAGTYALYSGVYDGSTTRFYVGTTPTSGISFGSVTAASGSLALALQGKNESGTNATAAYDALMIVPYALSTPMLAARVARTTPEPGFPFVEIDGDAVEDLVPVVVKGFVEAEAYSPLQTSFGRSLSITFVEK